MKKYVFLSLSLSLALAAASVQNAHAGAIRTQAEKPQVEKSQIDTSNDSSSNEVSIARPNAITAELFGRSALYTLGYDRSVTNWLGLGIGFSYWTVSMLDIKVSIVSIPIYGNFYLLPNNHRPFLSAGFDAVFASAKDTNYALTASASAIVPVIGAGYEYRADGGFLFRAAPYLFISSGQTQLWGGVSFGYAL